MKTLTFICQILMANTADINALPVLYHHPVVNVSSEVSFDVNQDFVENFGSHLGAYWVCHLHNGDIMRLHYLSSGRRAATVFGWDKMRNRFNVANGAVVDFYYLGGERFHVTFPDWDGFIYPDEPFTFFDDDEDDDDDNSDGPGAGKAGNGGKAGNDAMKRGGATGSGSVGGIGNVVA